jgi:hypothetical protein
MAQFYNRNLTKHVLLIHLDNANKKIQFNSSASMLNSCAFGLSTNPNLVTVFLLRAVSDMLHITMPGIIYFLFGKNFILK